MAQTLVELIALFELLGGGFICAIKMGDAMNYQPKIGLSKNNIYR